MPKAKLTLSVDPRVVERAKRFSRRNDTTVSQLVQDFLASLEDSVETAAPITARLKGVIPADVTRDEYRTHLSAKYD